VEEGQPSRTALRAAAYRAAHQTLDGGSVFTDPLALRILGSEADAIIRKLAADPANRKLRLFLAARSRFAEDCLAAAVACGVRQAVILGAGLDTFSLRNPHARVGLRVFEVDHPATQAWKRRRLTEVGIPVPPSLIFAPVDFAAQDLPPRLCAAGLHADHPAFFHWLGVVHYLEHAAISSTLRFIAGVPQSEVVFDYDEPPENYPSEGRANVAAIGARAAAAGEPWVSFFDPTELSRELSEHGFREQEDLGYAEIAVRYLGVQREKAKGGAGPHVVHARHA
jgi:methyltransferase (TIGR00027 family)